MASADYQRYVDETMTLAHSLLIKSEGACAQINELEEMLGYTVPSDPGEWRYYRHLAGEYHFLDEPMEIRSLDTLTMIPFERSVLADHPVTVKFYNLNGPYYLRLVERYPEQEQLIRGILYPVDKQWAINQKDYTILDHDRTLIESNESNVMLELQRRINHFFDRWNVPGYHILDELFTTAHLATLYNQLPTMLFNIRLENCHTPYVHGFHIKEFLRSHGRLDRYYEFLTRKQHLFLYRNIRYIENHAGKQDTFDWLLERILTERGVGLAEYTARHELTHLEEELTPRPEFLREGLNPYHRSVRSEEHTFLDILNKEEPLTPGNPRVKEATLKDDTERLTHTKRNLFPTKALESSIVDTSTGGYITLVELLFNHWIHWSFTGQYQATIRVPHPRTGSTLDLTPMDSLHLYWFAFNRSWGHTIDVPLTLRPTLLRKAVNPSYKTMCGFVDSNVLDTRVTKWFSEQPTYNSVVRLPDQFHLIGLDMLKAVDQQRVVFSQEEHYRARGYAEGLFWSLYETREYDLFTQQDIENWHFNKGFGVEDLTELEYEELALSIFMEASGLNYSNAVSLSDTQQALIQLMAQLSSYSIQFIREVNEGPIRFMDRLDIRLGDIDGLGKWIDRIPVPMTDVIEITGRSVFNHHVDVNEWLDSVTHMKTHHYAKIDLGSRFWSGTKGTDLIRMPVPPITMSVVE